MTKQNSNNSSVVTLDSILASVGLDLAPKDVKAIVRNNKFGISVDQVKFLTVKELTDLVERFNALPTTKVEERISTKGRIKSSLVTDVTRILEMGELVKEQQAKTVSHKRQMDNESCQKVVDTFLLPQKEKGQVLFDNLQKAFGALQEHFKKLPALQQAIEDHKALVAQKDLKIQQIKAVLEDKPYSVRQAFWGDKKSGKKGKVHEINEKVFEAGKVHFQAISEFWKVQKVLKAELGTAKEAWRKHKAETKATLDELTSNNGKDAAYCWYLALRDEDEAEQALEEEARQENNIGVTYDERIQDKDSGEYFTSSELFMAEEPTETPFYVELEPKADLQQLKANEEAAKAQLAEILTSVK